MNPTQIALLGAFDSAMQTLVEAYLDSLGVTDIQLAAAYGGALALYILIEQNTDANVSLIQAQTHLNTVAEYLSLPKTPSSLGVGN